VVAFGTATALTVLLVPHSAARALVRTACRCWSA
jgi:hypothetical protein